MKRRAFIDTARIFADRAITKLYDSKPSNVLLQRVRDEVGWGLETLDMALSKIQDSYYRDQTFIVNERVTIASTEFSGEIEGYIKELPKATEMSHGGTVRAYHGYVVEYVSTENGNVYNKLCLPHELRKFVNV